MLSGTLTINLRPLRIAFVVTPGDKAAIYDAIRICSYLWGGHYNPIIPLFRRLPSWVGRFSRPASATDFFASYLDLFDPDFVVRLGVAKNAIIELGNLKEIPAEEMLRAVTEYRTPSYGIGIFESLEHLLHEEFRFVRRDSLHMRIPDVGNDLFLSSVFGTFPDETPPQIEKGLIESLSYREEPCNLSNYFEFFESSNLFTRRICDQGLNRRNVSSWHSGYVFLMDPNDPNDVLLYWNYRALGWDVLPVPMQASASEFLRKQVALFVENNHWPLHGNPEIYNRTTVLGSPNVKGEQVEHFIASLELKPASGAHQSRVSFMHWLPRFWDEWARPKDGVERCRVVAAEQNISIRIESDRFQFEPLLPAFAREFYGDGTPRCANELEINIYSNKHEYAQVVPAGGDKLSRAAHFYGTDDLRCSKEGIVFYPKFTRWTVAMTAPSAETIFTAWFEERGWKVLSSDKGYIIKQILRQLGGAWQMNWLTEEPVLRFLVGIPAQGAIGEKKFRGLLNQLAATGKMIPADRLAKWLVESDIVRLGIDVTCPKCHQRSWYSVTEADYQLVCRQCLESYRLPTDTLKEMPWAYRGAGAFGSKVEVIVRERINGLSTASVQPIEVGAATHNRRGGYNKIPDGLQGGLTVLLLLHSLMSSSHPKITPMLSFNASKGNYLLEVDLAVLTRHMRHGMHQDDVVFAECKSFNRFERRDVQRMERFAQQFPASVVIFATLRRELDAGEKRLLIPFAKRGRHVLSAGRIRNPIVIFTGNELFSWNGPRGAWKEMGLPYSRHEREYGEDRVFVSLADATQQLYLGLPSIHAEKPRRARSKRP